METNILFKVNMVFIFVFFLILGLIYGKTLFIPLTFSILFTLLLIPIANKLESMGSNRLVTSILCVIFITLIFLGIILIIYSQLNNFIDSWPQLKKNSSEAIENFFSYFDNFNLLGINLKNIFNLKIIVPNIANNMIDTANWVVNFIKNAFFGIFLIAFEILFLLYYRTRIYNFILKITPQNSHEDFKDISINVQKVASKYLIGIFSVVLITTTLNTLGLLLIGIDYAVAIGLISGLLTVVPYVGVLFGSILAIFMALFSPDPIWSVIAVSILYSFNQLLENNIFYPYLVGSQVNVNPLIIINFLILGGLIWGIPGIILITPLLGIIKVILEHTKSLKPIAYLIKRG